MMSISLKTEYFLGNIDIYSNDKVEVNKMNIDVFMEVVDRLVLTGLSELEACLIIAELYEKLKEKFSYYDKEN